MSDTNPDGINMASWDRWTSAIGGGALATYGLLRRDKVGIALALLGAGLVRRGAIGHCPAYKAVGIGTGAAESLPALGVKAESGIKVKKAISINKSPNELFTFWRDFENLPKFMTHLESVKVLDDKKSHWVATAPLGKTVAWDAEIINETPDELIAWQSLPGADVDSVGSVTFRKGPQGRGTEVHVSLSYQPPLGQIGATLAKLFREEPNQQVEDDLLHFKELMETGEIPTIQGQPSGRGPDVQVLK